PPTHETFDVPGPLVDDRDFESITPTLEKPAPATIGLDRDDPGHLVDEQIAHRRARDRPELGRDLFAVNRHRSAVHLHLHRAAGDRHEVFHARSRTATVSTWA